MITTTLQQIIDERISFLKEQINPANKPEVNKTFQIQIDAIRSAAANNIEKVESLILQKNEQLKNSKDVYESDRIFAELDGLEWLQRQIAVYALVGRSMKKGVDTKI
jgi:HEAT repeat protein